RLGFGHPPSRLRIGKDSPQWLIDFVCDGAGQFARRREAIDMRQLEHPLPRLRLREMTLASLERKARNEDGLKQQYGTDQQNLPAIRFPCRGCLEEDGAQRRKVGLTDVPALHLPPVIFRRRVFGWRRLDVARLFSVEDT